MAASFKQIARDHGMPIDTSERPRMAATLPACRAVVAARVHSDRALVPAARAAGPALQRAAARRARRRSPARRATPGSIPSELARWSEDEAVDPPAARGHGAGARAAAGGARARREARQLVRRPALHVPELRDRAPQRRRPHRGARVPAVRGLRRRDGEPRARHAAPRAAVRRRARCSTGRSSRSRRRRSRRSWTSTSSTRASGSCARARTSCRSAPTRSGPRRLEVREQLARVAADRVGVAQLIGAERARRDRDDAHAVGAGAGDVARRVADDDRVARRRGCPRGRARCRAARRGPRRRSRSRPGPSAK